MTGKKATHQPRPPPLSQHFPEDGKTGQQKTFDILVNQSPVYPHALAFDTARARVRLGITNMRGKSVLEALKLGRQCGHVFALICRF